KTDFDANNILSDSDLNALLAAEDDDDAIIALDDEPELDLTESESSAADPLVDLSDVTEPDVNAEDEEIIDLDEEPLQPEVEPEAAEQIKQDTLLEADEPVADDELLEEIELDVPDEPEELTAVVASEQLSDADDILPDDDLASDDGAEDILVETDNSSEQLVSEHVSIDAVDDQLTDSQITSLVEDESFDRTELDAFAEALALEGTEQSSSNAEEEEASELLSAELDELLQQVEAVEPHQAATTTDDKSGADTGSETDETADELTDDNYIAIDSDAPDLQSNDDDSVAKPSEAALSVENPSKMLDSYPELELSDDDFTAEDMQPAEDAISVDISPADPDVDQSLAKLDDSQFDNLLTELEAMAHTTASDSEDLSLDVDAVFSPSLDDEETIALSDADFVEIDNLLASSEQVQEDDGRFEQLNVDVGLDEFADVIGNDNPQDVDAEDNGFAAKMDLVRAYIEIDDLDSASHIITEILDSDAPEHVKTEAKALQ
ncbi:MAG: FimV/HubP family polar landmark protein, partial [Oceanospirillum sp.]|nr:FimV/HubP family polar landmark protein [Oceanospirillum sp.]